MSVLPGLHEPGFVGAHDELRAVARVEFDHRATDVGLGRGGADGEPLGDFRVAQAVADERHHLALAIGELLQLLEVDPGAFGLSGELGDQPSRHARREERAAVGDDADRVEQVGWFGVLDIEGINWTTPPLFANPTQTQRINGRTYLLVDDGAHIHDIGWREGNALYWVSNTLQEDLTNTQMLDIANSAQPLH